MSDGPLNSAGQVARVFVNSKLTPLFVIAVLLLGMFAALVTPREENPQILVPGAQVSFYLPGATPTEIEHLIIAPMEAVVREIEDVDHTSAIAAAGMGQIQVQFEVGADKDLALTRLSQRIAANRHRLPATTLEPVIQQIDVDNVAIVTVTLASSTYDDYALRRLAERIAERLNTIEQVSVAELHGGRKREIRVNIDPARLQAYGLTLNEGVAMIAASNVSAIVGQLVDDGRNQTVYLKGQLNSLDEVRHLPLQVHKGQLIYLDDIADVVDGPAAERDRITRFSFGPGDPRHGSANTSGEMASVTLSVAKKPNTNAVAVSRDVLAMVAKMQAQFVPAEVSVVTTRDDGRDADHSVNSLIFDLGIAISSVLLVLVPFLGVRQAMIVCLVVPLVLGLTVAVDMLLGVTINRISLFALILALGMLVDDAIVVMENIHRHYEIGTDYRSATAVLATNEIGKPTTIATITIVLVFASLNILSGMNGAFFHPIAFNVPVAIGASLAVAYVVVPWACNRWLHQGQGARAEAEHEPDALHRVYFRLITPLLDRDRLRKAFFWMVGVALLASFLMPVWQFIRPSGVGGPLSFGGVSLAIMPKENRNSFSIAITMPEYTPIETTDRVARQFGEILGKHPLVSNYQTHMGLGIDGDLDVADIRHRVDRKLREAPDAKGNDDEAGQHHQGALRDRQLEYFLDHGLGLSVVVRCAGLLDVRLDQITVGADVLRPGADPVQHLDPVALLLAQLEHAYLVFVADLFENHGEIAERLQGAGLDRQRHRARTDLYRCGDEGAGRESAAAVVDHHAGGHRLIAAGNECNAGNRAANGVTTISRADGDCGTRLDLGTVAREHGKLRPDRGRIGDRKQHLVARLLAGIGIPGGDHAGHRSAQGHRLQALVAFDHRQGLAGFHGVPNGCAHASDQPRKARCDFPLMLGVGCDLAVKRHRFR